MYVFTVEYLVAQERRTSEVEVTDTNDEKEARLVVLRHYISRKIRVVAIRRGGLMAAPRKATRVDLVKEEGRVRKAYQKMSATSFEVFYRGLTIESATGPRVFETCSADFQKEFFEDVGPSLLAVQLGILPPRRRFWLERTKKSSKDADLAIIMMWLIAFPQRPLYLQVGAANRVQAAIVKDRMTHLLHWNPWLTEHVEIVQWEVRSKKKNQAGSHMALLHIMSSDISGAHGGIPDVLIVNELSHVDKWEFVENLMDNADGVAQGVVIIATNAGFVGTKAEVWRLNAMKSPQWCFHMLARPAPWHSKETVLEAEQRNTSRSRFRRLWHGEWQTDKGDALNQTLIERAFTLSGPAGKADPTWDYIMGLDLGITHDHCGLVCIGVNQTLRKIRLAYMEGFAPNGGEVFLPDVEKACDRIAKIFRPLCLIYDPHQAILMAQQLRGKGIPTRQMVFSSPGNLGRMASSLVQCFEHNLIELYDEDDRLKRDLNKFSIVEKQYGLKLEATRDEYGHADVGTALVITLPAAIDLLEGLWNPEFDGDLIAVETEDLTKEEIAELPDHFRDLFDMEDGVEKERQIEQGWDAGPFKDLT